MTKAQVHMLGLEENEWTKVTQPHAVRDWINFIKMQEDIPQPVFQPSWMLLPRRTRGRRPLEATSLVGSAGQGLNLRGLPHRRHDTNILAQEWLMTNGGPTIRQNSWPA